MREALEDEELWQEILDAPVLEWVNSPGEPEVQLFKCLHPEIAQLILLEGFITLAEEGSGWSPSPGEMLCMSEVAADTDAAGVMEAVVSDSPGPSEIGIGVEFVSGLYRCDPDWFIAVAEPHVDGSQRECLRGLILDLDPDLMGAILVDDAYGGHDMESVLEFWTAWDNCMSRLDGVPTPTAPPLPTAAATPKPGDDHPDSYRDATPLHIGEEMAGTLETEGDVDYFAFQATDGEIYRIETALGTLEQSTLEIYDNLGVIFLSSADYDGPPAARLDWQAYQPGLYYVAASGPGTGTYTLTVSTVADDHGDYSEMATPLNIGETTQGRIDHSSDIDFFVFDAVQGRSYRIAVEVGSLRGTWIELLNVDRDLGYSDYYRDVRAVRIDWVAPETASYWLAVGARNPGAYGVEVRTLPAKQ